MQTSTRALNGAEPQSTLARTTPFEQMLHTWLCHDAPAIAFMTDIIFIAARWDDLVDHDQQLLDSDIHQLLEVALSLPCNPFYIKHFAALHTLLHNSIRNWKVANVIERDPTSTEAALLNAYVLRASYADLIGHCAMLVGGNAWAEQVVKEVRLQSAKEGFAAYMLALQREQRHRDVHQAAQRE